MKKETIEEVADRLYPYEVGYGVFDRNCEIDIERQRFVEGAKFQQEISYSEEDFKLFARQFYREIKIDNSNLLWEELADKCFEKFKKK